MEEHRNGSFAYPNVSEYNQALQRFGKDIKDPIQEHPNRIKGLFGDQSANIQLKEVCHLPENNHSNASQHFTVHGTVDIQKSELVSFKNIEVGCKEIKKIVKTNAGHDLKVLPNLAYAETHIKTEKAESSSKARVINDLTNIPTLVKNKFPLKIKNNKGSNATPTPENITSQQILLFGSENDTQVTNSHQKQLRIFSCQKCTKSFRHKSSLKQHCISIHEQSKYKCPICLKEFNRISSLNTHKSIHDEEKKFKCGHCGKAFHQKGNLKHHIFTHVSIRPYVCTRCDKSFHQPSNLRTHMCIYDVMDPLPLAVILHEGEELGDLKFVNYDFLHQSTSQTFCGPGRNDLSQSCNWKNTTGNDRAKGNLEITKMNSQNYSFSVKPEAILYPPSIELDAISYCFYCNLGFTHKIESARFEYEGGGLCPSCGLVLYTRVIPKCEEGISAGKMIDEKYQTLQTYPNYYKENIV